jgi:hypothetical protein
MATWDPISPAAAAVLCARADASVSTRVGTPTKKALAVAAKARLRDLEAAGELARLARRKHEENLAERDALISAERAPRRVRGNGHQCDRKQVSGRGRKRGRKTKSPGRRQTRSKVKHHNQDRMPGSSMNSSSGSFSSPSSSVSQPVLYLQVQSLVAVRPCDGFPKDAVFVAAVDGDVRDVDGVEMVQVIWYNSTSRSDHPVTRLRGAFIKSNPLRRDETPVKSIFRNLEKLSKGKLSKGDVAALLKDPHVRKKIDAKEAVSAVESG